MKSGLSIYSVLSSYFIFVNTSNPYFTLPTGEYSPSKSGASFNKIKNWESSVSLSYVLANATVPLSNLNFLFVSDLILPYLDFPYPILE